MEKRFFPLSSITTRINELLQPAIFGSKDFTPDKEGLKVTKELKAILDLTVAEMEKTDLPELIAIAKPKTEQNPFL